VVHDYGHLVKAIKPRESLPEDPALLLPRVKALLEEPNSREWLLVLDDFSNDQEKNIEEICMLITCNLLPRNPNGRVLICVRDRMNGILSRQDIVPRANFIEVQRFSSTEAIAAFQACLSRQPNMTQRLEDLAEIVSSLDCLPLAVTYRALKERETHILASGETDHVLRKHDSSGQQQSQDMSASIIQPMPSSENMVSGLSFELLNNAPAILLNLLCLFQRPRVPEYLVQPMYKELSTTSISFDEALQHLEELALVSMNYERDEYEVPSLVRKSICSSLDPTSTVRYLNIIISGLSKHFPEPKSALCRPDLRDAWDSQTYLLSISFGVVRSAQQHRISTLEFAQLLFKAGTGMYHLRMADLAMQCFQQSLDMYSRLGAERSVRLPVMKFHLLAAAMNGDRPTTISQGQEYFDSCSTSELDPISLPYLLLLVISALLEEGDRAGVNSLLERTMDFIVSSGLYTSEQSSKLRDYLHAARSTSNAQPPPQTPESILALLDLDGSSSGLPEHVRLFFEDEDTVDHTIDKIFSSPKRGVYQDPYSIVYGLQSLFDAMDEMDYTKTNRIRTIGSRLLDRMPPYMTPQQITINALLTDVLGNACILEGDWADAEVYFMRELDSLNQAHSLGYVSLQEERDQAAYNVALCLCLQHKNRELELFEQQHTESLDRMAAGPEGKDFKKNAMMFFVTDAVRKAERRGETDTRAALLEALQNKLLEFENDEE
jgi:hypothetical protein